MEEFIRGFFRNYQSQLLIFVNSFIGRYYLGIKDKEPIVKLTENSYHLYIGEGKYKVVFRTYPVYAKKLAWLLRAGLLVPMAFKPQLAPLLALPTDSFFSGAGDGYVANDDNTTSWSSVRDATTGGTLSYTGTATEAASRKTTTPSWGNYRTFLPFDTSSLPDGDVITAATVKVYGKIKRNATTGWDLHCVETSQASTTELVAADYDNLTFTDLGSIAEASVAINQYNNITLNATGLTKISKTGFSKLGVITSFDLNNTEPSATDTDAGYRGLNFSTSEATGTTEDPTLEVTYTEATTTSTTTSTSTSTSTTSTSSSTSTTSSTSTSTTSTSSSTSSSTTTSTSTTSTSSSTSTTSTSSSTSSSTTTSTSTTSTSSSTSTTTSTSSSTSTTSTSSSTTTTVSLTTSTTTTTSSSTSSSTSTTSTSSSTSSSTSTSTSTTSTSSSTSTTTTTSTSTTSTSTSSSTSTTTSSSTTTTTTSTSTSTSTTSTSSSTSTTSTSSSTSTSTTMTSTSTSSSTTTSTTTTLALGFEVKEPELVTGIAEPIANHFEVELI